MPLRCFVACAFGHKDVNVIYDQAIFSVLKAVGIIPIRIDRVEHNDDIDDRIIRELNKCDFCIADLTYARPSVYYEAGYVIGSDKPVISTCRTDHFRAKPDDPLGNYRVHFDLQMKNIIPWTESNTSFKSKLKSRIDLVTRPLLLNLKQQEQTKTMQAEFMSMSDQEKFMRMASEVEKIIRKAGFEIPDEKLIRFFGYVYAVRQEKNLVRLIIIELHPLITKRDLARFHALFGQQRAMNLIAHVNGKKAKTQIAHVFCGGLRPVPIRRVAEALPYFAIDSELKRFVYNRKEIHGGREIIDLHIIDGITSIEDFTARFRSHLDLACRSNSKRLTNRN